MTLISLAKPWTEKNCCFMCGAMPQKREWVSGRGTGTGKTFGAHRTAC